MTSLAMETHEFIKELTVSGFTEHQAETIARHQALIINENLATKQDIQLLKQDIQLLKQDFERSQQELRQDFERSQQELRQDFELLKQELKQDMALLRQDMVLLKKELFIKLGMIFIGGWVAAIGIILGVMSMMLK